MMEMLEAGLYFCLAAVKIVQAFSLFG